MVSSAGAIRGMPGIGAYSGRKGPSSVGPSRSRRRSPRRVGRLGPRGGDVRTDILELTTTHADYDGPYGPLHANSNVSATGSCTFASAPDRFGPAVAKALEDRRPFARRAVGPDARLLMLGTRLLPSNLLGRITCRAIGVPSAGALHGHPQQTATVRADTIEKESWPEHLGSRRRLQGRRAAPRNVVWRASVSAPRAPSVPTMFSGIHRSSKSDQARMSADGPSTCSSPDRVP